MFYYQQKHNEISVCRQHHCAVLQTTPLSVVVGWWFLSLCGGFHEGIAQYNDEMMTGVNMCVNAAAFLSLSSIFLSLSLSVILSLPIFFTSHHKNSQLAGEFPQVLTAALLLGVVVQCSTIPLLLSAECGCGCC